MFCEQLSVVTIWAACGLPPANASGEHFMSILRPALIVPPLLIGIGLVYYAVSNKGEPARTPIGETATAVRVITTKSHSFVPRTTGFGTVQPSRTWDAIAQVSGRVTKVNPEFERGAFVQEGDVLIQLSPEDYELEIAQAKTDIAGAEVDIEELKLSLNFKQKSLDIEKAVLELEQKELARSKELLGRKVISDQTVENQQSAVLQQQAAVQNLENEIDLVPVQMRALEQAKEKSLVRLKIAQLNLARTTISAPFNARVSEVQVEIDQYVATGSLIGKLDGIDSSDVDVQITPSKMVGFVDMIFRGQVNTVTGIQSMMKNLGSLKATVSIGFSGVSSNWDANVTRISDTVDPATRSVGVIVSVADPYSNVNSGRAPPLVKGMFAEVELRANPVHNVTLVPRNAIVDGRIKIVNAENRLRFEVVEQLYQIDDVVVLKEPLADGTLVIVSDMSPVIEGMLLNPVEDLSIPGYLLTVAGTKAETEARVQ